MKYCRLYKKFGRGLIFTLLVLGCSSLATRREFYRPITTELQTGNIDKAVAMLETAREDGKYAEKDRLLYFIDAGLLYHYDGKFEISNEKLEVAESAAEELFTKSISRAALSILLNDNVLEYAGEDYEILYTNLVKALNYIALDDFDGAFVEIRRANQKLEVLQQKYTDAAEILQKGNPDDTDRVELQYEADEVHFYNDAFARYLSMHMYAAEGKYDDARIDHDYLKQAFGTQTQIYDFPLPEVKYRSKDKAILSVVGLAGLAPTKEAWNLRIRTDKQLNLVQILYTDSEGNESEYTHLPVKISHDFYFKFAIPKMVRRPSEIARIRVTVDDVQIGELQLIEDVSNVAIETFKAKRSLILIKSVARAIAKGLATERLKKKADDGSVGGWLKKLAIDVGTDLTENADLRSTNFLPGLIYVGDFEVEPGPHDVIVEYFNAQGLLITRTSFEKYQVLQNGLNLLEAYSVH